MSKNVLFPDYIFESSWEVCNKVGGIYAVLSTRAKTLVERLGDHLIFIGPDFPSTTNPYFCEDQSLFADWRDEARRNGLAVRVGRWNVPGNPVAVLVDFQPYFSDKNEIYTRLWQDYHVDSLHAYGDYDEASMFSYAAGLVVESFYKFYLNASQKVIYHGNEWMTGLGLLYIQKHVPEIATMFTTHATSIGRSIAGNMKPLYDYLFAYNGDQMAAELNMQSKHSIEKQTAWAVDCFTTVSDITAKECEELLDKPVDVVLPNGFENDFLPKGAQFTHQRKLARARLLRIANALMGTALDDDTLIISTSGRYEFRNKGIDAFIDSINKVRNTSELKKNVVAFIQVPAWMREPRKDLQERMKGVLSETTPLDQPVLTHWLYDMNGDNVLNMMRSRQIDNRKGQVKVIFVPCYLDGKDGIFNVSYFDLLIGNDLCVFPSYYEPWGYTPLEAIAFKVPCITTDLAGFGLWAIDQDSSARESIKSGVQVVHRSDYNYDELTDTISRIIVDFSNLSKSDISTIRANASKLSKKALWKEFIKYYDQAYDVALRKAEQRISNLK